MCFSAEASFAASAVITGCGVLAVRKAETAPQKAFGAIPLFFGVQQFTEGLLWVSLSNGSYAGWTEIATQVFLLFAWIIWPVYVPLSARLLERKQKRKAWLNLLLAMGTAVSLALTYALFFHDVKAAIAGHHINYSMEYEFDYQWLIGILYFLPIAFSLFISSVHRMWLVGAMILVSFALTAIFYREHLISVWCFFAAITSVSVLWMVYRMKGRSQS